MKSEGMQTIPTATKGLCCVSLHPCNGHGFHLISLWQLTFLARTVIIIWNLTYHTRFICPYHIIISEYTNDLTISYYHYLSLRTFHWVTPWLSRRWPELQLCLQVWAKAQNRWNQRKTPVTATPLETKTRKPRATLICRLMTVWACLSMFELYSMLFHDLFLCLKAMQGFNLGRHSMSEAKFWRFFENHRAAQSSLHCCLVLVRICSLVD